MKSINLMKAFILFLHSFGCTFLDHAIYLKITLIFSQTEHEHL